MRFSAKVAGVDTGFEARGNHLRNTDFFEVEKYPEMTFRSVKVEKIGDQLQVIGDFPLKGVTKRITIPFNINGIKDERGSIAMGISASTTINRQDYGVKCGNRMVDGTLDISDLVKIEFQVEAWMRKRPTAAGTISGVAASRGRESLR